MAFKRSGAGGVVAAVLAAGSLLAGGASAQVSTQAPDGAQEAQAERNASFNIPAQPLAQALTSFGQQAGIQIGVSAPAVAGKTSVAVSGTMTVEQALRQLLSGTGVGYRFTSPNVVTISGGPDSSGALQLDPVQVQGMFPVPSQAMIDNLPPPYAGGQVATGGQLGLLGNRGVMDTPFNQTNYTAKKAQDQQAKTVREVLIDDPSVRPQGADGGFLVDNMRIRGFPVNTRATTYGGLYGVAPVSSPMSELAERVEVLKGPSALLNGMPPPGSIGGTINIVPKRAPDDPLTQVTANYASAGQFGASADLARRFGPDNEFGVRLNGVYKSGQTEVQYNSDQRALGVLGLDFRGDHVRVSADLGYQYQYIGGVLPFLGVQPGVQLPWAPNARTNQGQPWTYQGRKDFFGTLRAEVDLTDNITAYASLGFLDSRVAGLWIPIVSANSFSGTAMAPVGFNNYSQYETFLTFNAGARANFQTGPIGHQVALTASTFEQSTGFGSVTGPGYATNFYNPTVGARPNPATPSAPKVSTQSLSSIGIADTLSGADGRVQLTAGLRLQNVTATNFNGAGLATSGYDQTAVSPAVALVFKPWSNVSLYGNYIQGLEQGTTVGPTFANAGQVFPPYQSTQYEVGVKAEWGKFTTTVSVFSISQPSLLVNAATNAQYLGGEQRNQGLEINVFGEPFEGVRLLGGVMFLNALLAKTQGGANDNWTAPFSPGFNLNLAGEWDLPFVRGLTVNGRVVYTAAQYIDTTLPRRMLPNWTRFDIGARYAFENPGAKGKLLVARFNVENLLDANYWAGGNLGATQLYLGTPRTFRVSLTADF